MIPQTKLNTNDTLAWHKCWQEFLAEHPDFNASLEGGVPLSFEKNPDTGEWKVIAPDELVTWAEKRGEQ